MSISSKTWYHGSSSQIETFNLSFVGRGDDAKGPGVYFTSSFDEARAYAITRGGRGFVHEIRLSPSFSELSGNPRRIEILELLRDVPNPNLFLDFGDTPEEGKLAAASLFLSGYDRRDGFETIWSDFWKEDSPEYLRRVVGLGFDGFTFEETNGEVEHLVLFNLARISSVSHAPVAMQEKLQEELTNFVFLGESTEISKVLYNFGSVKKSERYIKERLIDFDIKADVKVYFETDGSVEIDVLKEEGFTPEEESWLDTLEKSLLNFEGQTSYWSYISDGTYRLTIVDVSRTLSGHERTELLLALRSDIRSFRKLSQRIGVVFEIECPRPNLLRYEFVKPSDIPKIWDKFEEINHVLYLLSSSTNSSYRNNSCTYTFDFDISGVLT